MIANMQKTNAKTDATSIKDSRTGSSLRTPLLLHSPHKQRTSFPSKSITDYSRVQTTRKLEPIVSHSLSFHFRCYLSWKSCRRLENIHGSDFALRNLKSLSPSFEKVRPALSVSFSKPCRKVCFELETASIS